MERFQNFHVFSEVNKMIIKARIAYLILTKQKSIIPPHSKNIWLSDSQSQQKSCDCTGGRVFCQHKSWVPETGAPTLPAPSSVNTPGNQHFPEPGNGDDGAERGAHLLTDALGSVEVYFCKAVTNKANALFSHQESCSGSHTLCPRGAEFEDNQKQQLLNLLLKRCEGWEQKCHKQALEETQHVLYQPWKGSKHWAGHVLLAVSGRRSEIKYIIKSPTTNSFYQSWASDSCYESVMCIL